MFKNPPSDLKLEMDVINGFWRGVVEDIDDPLKAGRVRVRIHGIHSPKTIKTETDGIPVNELPWAQPAFPINEGSISGFGSWSVPLQGSHVALYFENGNIGRPIYFASLPGIPSEQSSYSNNSRDTSKTDGFKDPDEQYPVKSLLGEPDVNRLAREVRTGTIVETKDNNRDTGVSIAGGGSWSEPSSTYATQYPHNHVIATHGGIVIELDSTPDSKRINIYHPSNTFIEIDNSGNMIVKNAGEKYEIIANGKNIHITDNRNLTVGGDSNKKVDGNENIEIGGDKDVNISGNETETIGGNLDITITGNATVTANGTITMVAPTINLTGNTNITGILSSVGVGGVGGTMQGSFTIANGGLTVTSGDVSADGISLKTHVHSGVDSGPNNTGPPV